MGDPGAPEILGSPDKLACQFIQAYRDAKWFRRVPSLIWCVVPAPLAVLVTLGVYGALGLFLEGATCLCPASTIESTMPPVVVWCYFVGKLASPLVAVYLLLRLLRNLGRPRWVRIAAISTLSVTFLFILLDLHLISVEAMELSLSLTSGIASNAWMMGWQCGQVAMVIAGALWESHRNPKYRFDLSSR